MQDFRNQFFRISTPQTQIQTGLAQTRAEPAVREIDLFVDQGEKLTVSFPLEH